MAADAYKSARNGELSGYSRAEVAFTQWEIRRGVLRPPLPGARSGSPWWRSINERLLRDSVEGSLLYQESYHDGGSNPAVDHWLRFFESPSPDTWYCAHNASIVSGYLAAADLAQSETRAEQMLMNLILTRALYAYLLAARQARLGFLGRIGQWIAHPAGDGIVAIIDLPDFYPARYPMSPEDERELLGHGFSRRALMGRLSNLMVRSDVRRAFSWNAERIGIPELLMLTSDGVPTYPVRRDVVARPAVRGEALLES